MFIGHMVISFCHGLETPIFAIIDLDSQNWRTNVQVIYCSHGDELLGTFAMPLSDQMTRT